MVSYYGSLGIFTPGPIGYTISSSILRDMVVLELAKATYILSLFNGSKCVSKINLLTSASNKMLYDNGGRHVQSPIGG